MIGKLYIDGYDAYAAFGVFVVEGGYDSLVAFPPMKSIESNNWAEEDGEEFDLSAPTLGTREFSIKFGYHGANGKYGGLIELLSDKSYHTFDFREIDKTCRLRLVANPALNYILDTGLFTLSFADDFPLEGYSYSAPSTTVSPQGGYDIDGISLSDYGVCILQGSEAEILKSPAVKKNLLIDINSKSGAIYDGERVTFQAKDVKLNCLMRAGTLAEFWRNYNAFIYDLTRPEERRFYVDSTGDEYLCHYRNSSVKHFMPVGGKVWFSFSLTLVFNSFRVKDDEYLLSSEIGELIITEEEGDSIDLS